jgi:subtilisin family serine protease
VKPHIIIRLRRALEADVPHWESFIADKSAAVESIEPGIDAVLRRHGLSVWVTSEYPPAAPGVVDHAEAAAGLDRTYRLIIHTPDHVSDDRLESALDELRNTKGVELARPAVIGRSSLPTTSREASAVTEWPAEMIGLSYAHAFTTGDPGVRIAVLDTGVEVDHPELSGVVDEQKDVVDFAGLETSEFIGDLFGADDDAADEVGHGTHVAGIIAGRGSRMPGGVSPRCRLIAVRVLAAMVENGSRVGAGLVDNINVGIKWAVDRGADVINMSLGLRHEHGGLPHADVIDYALRKGVTVVAAAGNDGSNNKYYPGALPGVIAVGAADRHGQVAPFSSYGAHISFLAPGTEILSSFRGGGYAASSGTSQAAPFVAGAVALLESRARERGRRLGPRAAQQVLAQSSDRIDQQRRHPRAGNGVINLADAFRFLNHHLN